MKDCEPRDWPHLPDSRVNERPHWIIPHNAPGTKAQQLTLETEREKDEEGDGAGQGSGFQPVKAHGSTLTYTTSPLKNKRLGRQKYRPALPLSLDSFQPLLPSPSLSLLLVLALSVKGI